MIRRLLLAAALPAAPVAFALLATTPASAQRAPDDLARYHVTLRASADDVKLIGQIEAREVEVNKPAILTLTLSRTESYRVYGGCENACTSQSYTVRNSKGDTIASGHGDDPIVLPDYAEGKATLELLVDTCYQKPKCWIAAGLYITQ